MRMSTGESRWVQVYPLAVIVESSIILAVVAGRDVFSVATFFFARVTGLSKVAPATSNASVGTMHLHPSLRECPRHMWAFTHQSCVEDRGRHALGQRNVVAVLHPRPDFGCSTLLCRTPYWK